MGQDAIEPVARAIFNAIRGHTEVFHPAFEHDQEVWFEAATEAVKAMRDPSNAMLNAAAKAMSPGRRPTPERVSVKEKHRIRFQAMIDECLGDPYPTVSAEDGEGR